MSATARSVLPLATLLLLWSVGCDAPTEPATPDGREGWVAGDPTEWPRIALVNRIDYVDASHPMAGSAFLLQTEGGIVAVTAKHVLRYFKSETMNSVAFGDTLVRWEMFPKDAPDDVTVVGALINEDAEESLEDIRAAGDWLLFTVTEASRSVMPLQLRKTPLEAGEVVFVVGWRYTDEGRQHVYPGRYVRSEAGSVLIDVHALEDNTVPGLSGAPVIDGRGDVVGLMSSKSGTLQRLAAIDYPQQVLVPAEPSADCARRMTEQFRLKGWVGITPEIDAAGVITVVHVFDGSPAQKGGVRPDDVVRGINGVSADRDRAAFEAEFAALRPGRSAVLDLEREGSAQSVEILVEPIPDAVLEDWIRRECP